MEHEVGFGGLVLLVVPYLEAASALHVDGYDGSFGTGLAAHVGCHDVGHVVVVQYLHVHVERVDVVFPGRCEVFHPDSYLLDASDDVIVHITPNPLKGAFVLVVSS